MADDRTLQLRLTGFRKAEASLRLEGMDPSGTPLYESVKVKWSTKTGHRVRVFPVSVF